MSEEKVFDKEKIHELDNEEEKMFESDIIQVYQEKMKPIILLIHKLHNPSEVMKYILQKMDDHLSLAEKGFLTKIRDRCTRFSWSMSGSDWWHLEEQDDRLQGSYVWSTIMETKLNDTYSVRMRHRQYKKRPYHYYITVEIVNSKENEFTCEYHSGHGYYEKNINFKRMFVGEYNTGCYFSGYPPLQSRLGTSLEMVAMYVKTVIDMHQKLHDQVPPPEYLLALEFPPINSICSF